MPANRSLICSLVLLPLVVSPEDDVARWAPDTGEEIEWRWCVSSTHELDRLGVVHDSDGMLARALDSWDARTFEVHDVLEVVARDRIVDRDELAPTQLEREFACARRWTGLSRRGYRPWGHEELEAISPFEGTWLVFSRDTADLAMSALRAVDAGGATDKGVLSDLLGGLDEELDLRGWLGDTARAPGERWSVEADPLMRLARPGGELALAAAWPPERGASDADACARWLGVALLATDRSAQGRAHYLRVERDGDTRLALIEISATIEARGTVLEALQPVFEIVGAELASAPHVEHTIRIEGMLRWDLEARRAHSLVLEGSTASRFQEVFQNPWAPEEEGELAHELHGPIRIQVECQEIDG